MHIGSRERQITGPLLNVRLRSVGPTEEEVKIGIHSSSHCVQDRRTIVWHFLFNEEHLRGAKRVWVSRQCHADGLETELLLGNHDLEKDRCR